MQPVIISLIQKLFFRLRERFNTLLISCLRKLFWQTQGMSVGRRTVLPRLNVTWPHQVSIGEDCILESDIFFKFDGIWEIGPAIKIENSCFIGANTEFNIRKGIAIGKHCLIASGCKFIDHDHGLSPSALINSQLGKEAKIEISENVWLGVNVVVLKGVHIGTGAVVAAGAVVTKSIPSNEIWAGIPASRISTRFER